MKINVQITNDNVSPFLTRKVSEVENLYPLLKMATGLFVRGAQKNARRNGGKSLWFDIADSVHADFSDNQSRIVAKHKLAKFKHDGGVIRPKKAGGKLAFPQTDLAKRYWPRQFPGKLHREGATLKDDSGELLYLLISKATIKADPWWPSDSEMKMYIGQAISIFEKKLGA